MTKNRAVRSQVGFDISTVKPEVERSNMESNGERTKRRLQLRLSGQARRNWRIALRPSFSYFEGDNELRTRKVKWRSDLRRIEPMRRRYLQFRIYEGQFAVGHVEECVRSFFVLADALAVQNPVWPTSRGGRTAAADGTQFGFAQRGFEKTQTWSSVTRHASDQTVCRTTSFDRLTLHYFW